jgi:curved DNA-binding protein CbpA
MKTNYYEILGVSRSASEAEIRERFRTLARERHPDRYKGPDKADAEKKFQTLTEAVNILSNPNRRKQHDMELQAGSGKAPSDPAQVAKAYLAIGVKAYKEGDFTTACANFDLAAKHAPQDAKSHHYLALACSKSPSGLRQAVQAIERAVQLEPYNPLFLKDAGVIARRAGLVAKAERYFEEALKWDAENFDIQTALAEIRQSKNKKR